MPTLEHTHLSVQIKQMPKQINRPGPLEKTTMTLLCHAHYFLCIACLCKSQRFVIYCGLGIPGTLYHITCFTRLKINYPFNFFPCRDGQEAGAEEQEEQGEDPYDFSLSSVIDECASIARSQEQKEAAGPSSTSASGPTKRKIVKSSYFSDDEEEADWMPNHASHIFTHIFLLITSSTTNHRPLRSWKHDLCKEMCLWDLLYLSKWHSMVVRQSCVVEISQEQKACTDVAFLHSFSSSVRKVLASALLLLLTCGW